MNACQCLCHCQCCPLSASVLLWLRLLMLWMINLPLAMGKLSQPFLAKNPSSIIHLTSFRGMVGLVLAGWRYHCLLHCCSSLSEDVNIAHNVDVSIVYECSSRILFSAQLRPHCVSWGNWVGSCLTKWVISIAFYGWWRLQFLRAKAARLL